MIKLVLYSFKFVVHLFITNLLDIYSFAEVQFSPPNLSRLIECHLERTAMLTIKQGWLEYAYEHKIAIGITLLTVIGCLIVYVYFGGPGDPGLPGDSSCGSDLLGNIVEKVAEVAPQNLVYGGQNSIYIGYYINRTFKRLMEDLAHAIDSVNAHPFGTYSEEYWLVYCYNPIIKNFYLFFSLCGKVADDSGLYGPFIQTKTFLFNHIVMNEMISSLNVKEWSYAGQQLYKMVTYATNWAHSVSPEIFKQLEILLNLVKTPGIFSEVMLDSYSDVVDLTSPHYFDYGHLVYQSTFY